MSKYLTLGLFLITVILAAPSPAAAQTWAALSPGITNDLNNLACVDERTCFAVGGAPFIGGPGIIIKTTNGGESWSTQTIPTTNPLHGISCPSPLVCYVAGDSGTLLKTVNGGTTWTAQSAQNLTTFPGQAQPWFWDVWATSETTAVAVGNVGAIYRTTNGGSSWTQVVAGAEEQNLHGVFFANDTTGWIMGGGVVLKTTNGGTSWTRQTPSDLSPFGWDAFSFDGVTVWVSGSTLHKSTNGGASWVKQVDPLVTYRGIEFTDENNGWIVGALVQRTTNGGATWTQVTVPTFQTLRDVQCIGPDLCYAVGDDGTILRRGTPPPPSQADLVVGDRTLTCPAGELGLEFAEYRYNIVVRNIGTADAGPFTVRLQGLDAAGNPVGTPVNNIVIGLADGVSATIDGQANVGLLNPTATATATVRITADILGQVAESNETNNVATMTQTCATATTTTPATTPDKISPPANRPPNPPRELKQRDFTGGRDEIVGFVDDDREIIFHGFLSDPDTTQDVALDVEVKRIGVAFDGELIRPGLLIPNNNSAGEAALFDSGSYHWRVRARDAAGSVSDWVSFGGNAETASDFAILPPTSEIQPPAPPPTPEPTPAKPAEQAMPAIPAEPSVSPAKPAEPAVPAVPPKALTPEEQAVFKHAKEEERKLQIEKITMDAPKILGGFSAVVEEKQIMRDEIKEQFAQQKFEDIAKVVLSTVPEEKKATIEEAMKAFIAYGAPTKAEVLDKPIEKLGAGERAGVVNSFKEAFGKLPETEKDWEDVMKIAIGRFPSQTNPEREKEAEASFKKVYLRNPVRTQANDNACITVIAYGLRPDKRNLNSEKVAIQTFKKIFKKVPSSASDWDTVRCIGYSGATR